MATIRRIVKYGGVTYAACGNQILVCRSGQNNFTPLCTSPHAYEIQDMLVAGLDDIYYCASGFMYHNNVVIGSTSDREKYPLRAIAKNGTTVFGMGDSGEWNAYSSLHNISDRDDGIGKTDNHDRYYGAQHIWQDRHIYQLHSVTLTGWREDRIHEILTADSFDSYNYWYVRALVRHGAWTYLGYIYILYGASDNDKNHLIEGCSETQHWSLANVQGNRYVQCGSKWILVGNNGALYVSSSQTTKPEERTSGTTENLYDAALIDGKIVVVGAHGTMLISSDGTTWTPIDSGTGETLYAIAAK